MKELDIANKTIMVVGAHPDDNDFVAAGLVARAVQQQSKVYYVVATRGDRGSREHAFEKKNLMEQRDKEQKEAAKKLGVSEVKFLEHNDGEVEANIHLKEDIVKCIRKYRPDMVVTMDPLFMYDAESGFVNHTDHRKIGEAVMDAVYPLARDKLSFQHHETEGLLPHTVKELCFGASFNKERANAFVDITEVFDTKIEALKAHTSQITDVEQLRERLHEGAKDNGKTAGCQLAELFVHLVFNR